ncbi:histone-lysine N-methyltransferase SETMAR [Trichonephila clavipes]|nr:histone-lysine N-methyltransferase SETMAR [Trichonephila clavipes]
MWVIRTVRPKYAQQGSWFLFTTMFTLTQSISLKNSLGKKGVVQIKLPPCSLAFYLPDIFLFPRLKLALKGKRFDDIPDIQRKVTRFLNSIPREDILQSFQNMYSRSHRCIVMGGDYFEGQ